MGTALAVVAAENSPVVLWSIEPDVIEDINKNSTNSKYLRGIKLGRRIRATGDLKAAVGGATLVVVAVPSQVTPALAKQLSPLLTARQYVLNATKGINAENLKTAGEILRDALPPKSRPRAAVLSGPSIANEFGAGLPCAVVVAAKDARTAAAIARILTTDSFRALPSTDIRGTGLGGALKNIYALGLGMVDGLHYGLNAKASLLAASLAEMSRLFKAFGGRPESALALSGLGDLVVTGMSEHSRNRRFGEEICLDASCRIKIKDPAQTIEGVKALQSVAPFAHRRRLQAPILFGIERVVFKNESPEIAIKKIFRSL